MVDKIENLESIRNDDKFTKELEKDVLIDLHPDDPMRKGSSDVDRVIPKIIIKDKDTKDDNNITR